MDPEMARALEERTFSVCEYTDFVNTLVAPLAVQVLGEVSGLRVMPQWVFFDLKDIEGGGVLRCGMHSSGYRRLGVLLEDGMQITVSGAGKVTVKSGNFGFWVRSIALHGEGSLRRAYELLLVQLEKEGLFRQKRTLPLAVQHVAVVTSLSGVVIEDFKHNLAQRNIRVSVLHSGVDGAKAAPEIVHALCHAAALLPDAVVVIRGGGSLESLQAFNTEEVARALFACPVPTVVGIGHDVDVPIASMVADIAVSTPTAAAHAINDSWNHAEQRTEAAWSMVAETQKEWLLEAVHSTEQKRERVLRGMDRVRHLGEQYAAQVEEWLAQAYRSHTHFVERTALLWNGVTTAFSRTDESAVRRMHTAERMLVAHDPRKILGRGYAIPYTKKHGVVTRVKDVEIGEILSLLVQDGTIHTTVTGEPHTTKKL